MTKAVHKNNLPQMFNMFCKFMMPSNIHITNHASCNWLQKFVADFVAAL